MKLLPQVLAGCFLVTWAAFSDCDFFLSQPPPPPPPFFSHTINISDDLTLIQDITGRRRRRRMKGFCAVKKRVTLLIAAELCV